jgi:hypothetical protein
MVEHIINIYYDIKIMLAKKPLLRLLLLLIMYFILGYIARVVFTPTELGYQMLISSYRRLGDRIIKKTKKTIKELGLAKDPVTFGLIIVDYIIFLFLFIIASTMITLICCCGYK